MGLGARNVIFVLVLLFILVEPKAIHISGKLDFGNAAVASLVNKDKKFPVMVSRVVDTVESPSEISSNISCGSTGCNTTKSNNSLETQVLVRVQTKVNFDSNQEKKALEDASDVPIVIGYRASTSDYIPNEAERRAGYSGSDYTPFRPEYSGGQLGFRYNQRNGPSTEPPYYDLSTYRSTTGFYAPPSPSGYYGPSTPSYSGSSGYFRPSTVRFSDQNGLRPSSVALQDSNRRNYDYNGDNRAELQIPYFEHTYNKHYFNEEPPPHTVSLGRVNTHNPVEFRGVSRNKWRPSFWNDNRNHKYAFDDERSNFGTAPPRSPAVSIYNQPVYHQALVKTNQGTECSCKEQRSERTGDSNSYAASSVNHLITLPSKQQGDAIDDKLAHLN